MRRLEDFAQFILDNHLSDYNTEQLELMLGMEVPLMKLFSHLSKEDLKAVGIEGAKKFIQSLIDGTAIAIAKESLVKWEADELEEGISKKDISPSDLVLIYTAQKLAVLKFLPEFTSDIKEGMSISRELEMYYSEAQNGAIQLLFKMQKEAESEKQENQKIFAQFLDSLPNGVMIVDKNSKIEYLNKKAKELLAVKNFTAIVFTEISRSFFAGTNETYPLDRSPILRGIKGESTNVDDMEIENNDGKRFPIEIWAAPVYDSNGSIKYSIATFQDITEKKKNISLIEKQAEDLAVSNRELEQFASIASHDLQEPLRTITGFLQLFEKKYKNKLDAEADEYINYTIDASSRMRVLIQSLLEYSKINNANVNITKVDLKQLIEDLKNNLKTLIEETQAVISSEELPVIEGDYNQILQLFQNLVVNGIKFRDKSKAPRISISAEKKNEQYKFIVKDNGIGIDPKFSKKIFEIFQRLHNRNEYEGSGIGLAVCKKIVEKHGGKIWMDSNEGEGTAFSFTLSKTGNAKA